MEKIYKEIIDAVTSAKEKEDTINVSVLCNHHVANMFDIELEPTQKIYSSFFNHLEGTMYLGSYTIPVKINSSRRGIEVMRSFETPDNKIDIERLYRVEEEEIIESYNQDN